MRIFLNLVALLPMLGFIMAMIYTLIAKEEVYINHHWFALALVSLQASADRLKNVNPVNIMVFVSSILANIVLLIASNVDLNITPATFGIFWGYLVIGFVSVMGNLAMNWYKHLGANKIINSGP